MVDQLINLLPGEFKLSNLSSCFQIVFTHLKPQGFNRPRRLQGLILEGLATEPEQRLKLEALRERLVEIQDNNDGGGSCSIYGIGKKNPDFI